MASSVFAPIDSHFCDYSIDMVAFLLYYKDKQARFCVYGIKPTHTVCVVNARKRGTVCL